MDDGGESLSFDKAVVGHKVAEFELALSSAKIHADDMAWIAGDLAWLKIQLREPDPNIQLIREIAASLRRSTEALPPDETELSLPSAARALWTATGI